MTKKAMMVLFGSVALATTAGTYTADSGNAISLESGGGTPEISAVLAVFDSRSFTSVYSNASDLNTHRQGLYIKIH